MDGCHVLDVFENSLRGNPHVFAKKVDFGVFSGNSGKTRVFSVFFLHTFLKTCFALFYRVHINDISTKWVRTGLDLTKNRQKTGKKRVFFGFFTFFSLLEPLFDHFFDTFFSEFH